MSETISRPGGPADDGVRPASPTAPTMSAPEPAGARQSTLRATNLALVAQHVFAAPTLASRADVAGATGMTRSTASRLADELVTTGIVEERTPLPARGPGRPAVPLAPASGTFVALGLEVNVSRISVRAVDLAGQVLAERIVVDDLEGSSPGPVLGRLADLVSQTLSLRTVRRARLIGATLALPGLVRGDTLLRAPNLGWHDVRPLDHLGRALTPVGSTLTLGNEADLAALTATRRSPAGPVTNSDVIYLSGENGVGSGVVRDGAVMLGASGFAGEVGHILVDPTGPECGCGNRGCVERYAGRRAILRAAGLPPESGPEALLAARHRGEDAAAAAVSAAAHALAVGLGAAINVLGITTVVLGGHLAPLTEVLRPELERELDRRVLASRWSPVTVLPAPDDESPGATGAAWSLLEQVVADPAAWI